MAKTELGITRAVHSGDAEVEDCDEEEHQKAKVEKALSSLSRRTEISVWSDHLTQSMEQLVTNVENEDEFVKFLKNMKAEFPSYASEVNCLLQACQQQSTLTLQQHLRSRREDLINFLCHAGEFCEVSRTTVRRYVRSCEGAALHKANESGYQAFFRQSFTLMFLKHWFATSILVMTILLQIYVNDCRLQWLTRHMRQTGQISRAIMMLSEERRSSGRA